MSESNNGNKLSNDSKLPDNPPNDKQPNKLPYDKLPSKTPNDSKLPIMTDSYTESMKLPKVKQTYDEIKEQRAIADNQNVNARSADNQNANAKNTDNLNTNVRNADNQNTNARNASSKKRRRRLPLWLRIILKTMRVLLVPVLCLVALYVGLVIGYGKIGGQDPSDVLKVETWKHLYDLVFAE